MVPMELCAATSHLPSLRVHWHCPCPSQSALAPSAGSEGPQVSVPLVGWLARESQRFLPSCAARVLLYFLSAVEPNLCIFTQSLFQYCAVLFSDVSSLEQEFLWLCSACQAAVPITLIQQTQSLEINFPWKHLHKLSPPVTTHHPQHKSPWQPLGSACHFRGAQLLSCAETCETLLAVA